MLGIKKVLGTYHIEPADIIAFGDGINDIGMLKFAGRGIAMGTADDAVKTPQTMLLPPRVIVVLAGGCLPFLVKRVTEIFDDIRQYHFAKRCASMF